MVLTCIVCASGYMVILMSLISILPGLIVDFSLAFPFLNRHGLMRLFSV